MTLAPKWRNSGGLLLAVLTSCSTMETVPVVSINPNSSGIELSGTKAHGPKNLLKNWEDGKPDKPDTPSGVTVNLRRIQSLHNKEPRYFIPASGTLQVVSIERYREYEIEQGNLSLWQELLDSGEKIGAEKQNALSKQQCLPGEIPWMNAGRCFYGKLRIRTFPWGKAILYLTSYVQGKTGGPVNNDMLVLVAQGLTFDGRYAVNGHFEIRHPKLPDSSWDTRSKGNKVHFSIDDEAKAAESWLDLQSDDSFEPSIGQYESFLEALQIAPGKPYTNKGEQVSGGKRE